MKRLRHSLLAIVIVLGVFGVRITVNAGPSSPSTNYTISNITCGSVSISGNTTAKNSSTIDVFIKDKTTNVQIGSTSFAIANNGDFSGTLTFPPAEGDSLRVHVVDNGGDETFTGPACGSADEVTWCDLSDDGRLDGLCGDRIVVYCNDDEEPANLDVFVIDNQGGGHELTTLSLDDINDVDPGQFVKNLGANGIIYAGGTDDVYYVGLQGGPYGGTAKGDWLKANLPCDG